MTGRIASLWRFPIKSHGREAVNAATLSTGACFPWDRVWAVAHEASRAGSTDWSPPASFANVAKAPALAAIEATLNEATETITLRHPNRPDLTFQPDTEASDYLDWVAPLIPVERAAATRIVRVPGRGMTDSAYPSVTLCNAASHRAVEGRVGRPLSIHRWRGNIWLDGLGPWEEFEWVGRTVRVGEAVLKVIERTERCMTTAANPDTGHRDTDILGALDSWNHRDFSVLAEVLEGGRIATGDLVEPE